MLISLTLTSIARSVSEKLSAPTIQLKPRTGATLRFVKAAAMSAFSRIARWIDALGQCESQLPPNARPSASIPRSMRFGKHGRGHCIDQ